MENKNMITAERLKSCRIKADKTLEQIGTLLNVHKTTVMRWEKGETERIGLPTIQTLAAYYNVNPAWLMGADISPTNNNHLEQAEIILSERERKIIVAYRARPEMQTAVDKLLGIDEEVYITKMAARNGDNGVIGLTRDQINEIINAPDVPEDL